MNETYFRQLLEHYVTGQITEPDSEEFFRLLEQEQYHSLLEKIMQQEWETDAYTDTPDEKIGALIENYVIGKIQSPAPVRSINIFRRVAAAAAIIILLAAGYFLFFTKRDPQKEIVEKNNNPENDAKPGSYKAKLTLADGSTIVLDSAVSGELTRQGNTSVLNKDGQLVYDAQGAASQTLYNTLTTARGEIYSTVLADGSKVWLNAASSIKFPVSFTGNQRVVEITGEAYFEIAKNAAMPFIVKTAQQEITVLGTHFNVNAYPNEPVVRTTLLEGSVKVTSVNNNNGEVIIRPGEQSVLENILTVKKVNTDQVVAWKNGYFQFNNSDIQTVMRQLARWYDLEVEYEGAIPKDLFGGRMPRDANASEVLKALEQTQVHFRIEGKQLIVMP